MTSKHVSLIHYMTKCSGIPILIATAIQTQWNQTFASVTNGMYGYFLPYVLYEQELCYSSTAHCLYTKAEIQSIFEIWTGVFNKFLHLVAIHCKALHYTLGLTFSSTYAHWHIILSDWNLEIELWLQGNFSSEQTHVHLSGFKMAMSAVCNQFLYDDD